MFVIFIIGLAHALCTYVNIYIFTSELCGQVCRKTNDSVFILNYKYIHLVIRAHNSHLCAKPLYIQYTFNERPHFR